MYDGTVAGLAAGSKAAQVTSLEKQATDGTWKEQGRVRDVGVRELTYPVFRMSLPAYLHFLPSVGKELPSVGKEKMLQVMVLWVGVVGMLLAELSLSNNVVMD